VVGFKTPESVEISEVGLSGRTWISVPAPSHFRRNRFTLPA
jgi:hypothetical protein